MDLPPAGLALVALLDLHDGEALVLAAGPHTPMTLSTIRVADGDMQVIRSSVDDMPDDAFVPDVRAMTFHDAAGREVHGFVYAPRNPSFAGPPDERPPYIAFVHGGPTSHGQGVSIPRSPTSRAGGSGSWTSTTAVPPATAASTASACAASGESSTWTTRSRSCAGLVEQGLADPARLAIRGGSAGGWTVLAALTGTDVFACGTSYYGVAELLQFAQDTHDFESRYLDGLIGALPESRALYEERAPLNHVDELSCPVLLLQGLDDPVVPPSQSEQFRDAMVRKGIPHAYLAFEGESHGFRMAATVATSLEAELSFYGQVLGFTAPGVPELPLVTE